MRRLGIVLAVALAGSPAIGVMSTDSAIAELSGHEVAVTARGVQEYGMASPLTAGAVATIRSDAEWILKSQSADGDIATTVDRARIRPYLGNYAALGLAAASRATGDRR